MKLSAHEAAKVYNAPTKTMKMIRVSWKISDLQGHGLLQPLSRRKTLEEWCDYYNKQYGPGSHWIEEVEV